MGKQLLDALVAETFNEKRQIRCLAGGHLLRLGGRRLFPTAKLCSSIRTRADERGPAIDRDVHRIVGPLLHWINRMGDSLPELFPLHLSGCAFENLAKIPQSSRK
jgi:hypothetical protein